MKRRHDVIQYEGVVKTYSDSYSKNSSLIIATEIGDVIIPLKDSTAYPINQKVFIKIEVEMI